MKVLIPLFLGLFLAVGLVKLSAAPEPSGDELLGDTPGGEADPLLHLPAEAGLSEDDLDVVFEGRRSGATRAKLAQARVQLERKLPTEAERRAAFEAMMAAQIGAQGSSLDDLEALLRGMSLDEENLSNGVLMPVLDGSAGHEEAAAFDALGLTEAESAALAKEALKKGWF